VGAIENEEPTVLPRTPRVRVRPHPAGDQAIAAEVFAGLSPESRRRRYLANVDALSEHMLAVLGAVDGDRHVAFVAEVGRGRSRRAIGVARFVVDGPGRAELAYEVVDAWHGRGVGTRLVRALVAAAWERGLAELHAIVRRDNEASLAVLRRHLPTLRVERDGDDLAVSALLSGSSLAAEDLFADLQAA
jgi:RimJ/RimL family protein N-acetyltransferase